MSRSLSFSCAALLALLCSLPARAIVPRTFVASTGNDSNACTRTAPCRTFGAAIAAVSEGGEVIVLDSAGYGPVSIIKAVSLISPTSIYAGITTNSATGISIQGLTSNQAVLLRGLNLNDQGSLNNQDFGIDITSNCRLEVENCQITGFTVGINQETNGVTTRISVDNTILRKCQFGTWISSLISTGFTYARFSHCVVTNSASHGFLFQEQTRSVLVDCISDHNFDAGYKLDCLSNTKLAAMHLENCVSFGNGNGIRVQTNSETSLALVRASNCTITDNTGPAVNLVGLGSVVLSRGNNTVEDNGSGLEADNSISSTYAAK